MPTKLGDLCSVITKGTTPTSIGFDFSDSGVRFLRVQNIFDGKVNYDDDTLFIGEDVHDALKRSQIAPGDVLISIAGTIGRTGIVPDHAPELNCNQAVAILRTNEKVYQPFLRHWLESAEAQRQMRGATVTGTIQNLSLSQIGELRIPLPPLPEQRRIAAILDKADALRTKRREALAQLDRLAQSMFVEMFGDQRPGSVGANSVKLTELVDINPRLSPDERILLSEADVTFVPMAAVSESERRLVSVDLRPYSQVAKGYTSFKRGDVLLAKITPCYENGKMAITSALPTEYGFGSTEFHVFRAPSEELALFVFYLLGQDWVFEVGAKSMKGAAGQRRVPADFFGELLVSRPEPRHLKEFLIRVSKIEGMKNAARRALADMDSLFSSLQSRAFSGSL